MSVWKSTTAASAASAASVAESEPVSQVSQQDSMALAPPPELTYKSKEDMVAAIQEWARNHGYAISTKKSYPAENRYIYQCDKLGAYKSKTGEGKLGKTQKTQCPFEMSGCYYKREGAWRVKVKTAGHNHEPSADPSAHSIHCRTTKQLDLMNKMTEADVQPLKIKNAFMQESTGPISSSLNTIYNHKNKARIDYLEGKSPIEALIFEIRKSEFMHQIQNEDGHITSLFLAHPDSIKLACMYNTTYILDCMYKTNKHKMPLLQICGMDGMSRLFCVAFCFISNEKKESYMWVLQQFWQLIDVDPKVLVTNKEHAPINAIEAVFPSSAHLLCWWHVYKNIQKHC